jgi:hypothetical protein
LENNEYVIGSLYGFLSHYVLDYIVHPFIFYKGGLHNGMHRVYEMALTKYVLLNNNINSNIYKISNDLDFDRNTHVIKLLNHVLKETYNVDNGGYLYYKGLNKVKNTYRIFRYDKYGIKKIFYKCIDLFYKYKLSSISFYNIKDVDFNLEHKAWHHPCNNKTYKTSLIDLYNKGYKIMDDIIKNVNLVLNNKLDIDSLYKIIGNKSLINGLDSDTKHKMRYFEI